uniref:cation-translocating P-type ATPase n=1 Tax=Acetatifactor sp. TaxID=1872090 RepID=UPI00405683EB
MFEQGSAQDAIQQLKSDSQRGLSEAEAKRRLQINGRNEMKAPRKKTGIETFLEQLQDPLIYVLLAAAGVSVFLHEMNDAIIIGVVVFVNALVGMIQEGKARKALEALKKMTSPKATVIRDGVKQEIPAAQLVTGDIVCLEAGFLIPADMRLLESANLKVEESTLTGESLPIEKDAECSINKMGEIPLGDRRNMAYMSTIVTYGRGKGVVTATGMHTEIGKIATMITAQKDETTPLQKRLGELGKVLSILSIGLCVALFVVAIIQHRNLMEMLLTAISLAVAAVPEGLPAVVTICLALSVTRMVRVNTIVRRLPSVETLGAVSVVCSDKTGTLTQNKMTVEKCFLDNRMIEVAEEQAARENRFTTMDAKRTYRDFFLGMLLCNDASTEKGKRVGDPTELALVDFAAKCGLDKQLVEKEFPRNAELPFDSDRKMMSTFHRSSISAPISFTKGAPDEVLKRCTQIKLAGSVVRMTEGHRRQIKEALNQMASQALRTLAVAMRTGVNGPVEEQMVFLGVVGMKDPARPEAADAVNTFKEAGVDTVMITGDHVDTAFAIGQQLHIVEDRSQCMTGESLAQMSDEEFLQKLEHTRVFARVSPAQKVRIVKGFQQRGEIVAMTGDGVNDAPSLKSADIGIAMGMTGTDVAKQASDMILTDDNFATIERAIEEGRGVYENIRKSVIFLLSSNLGEIMTMFAAVLCGLSSPLKSSHILWINLITDSLPALALGIDQNDGKSLMQHPPRKKGESLFARGGLVCTCFYGVLIACISLAAFLMLPCALLNAMDVEITVENLAAVLSKESVLAKSQTYSFTVLGMSQLFHAVGMRDMHRSVLRMRPSGNKLMIGACILGFALQFAVTEVPFLINAFGTSHLSGREWGILVGLAAFPLLAHEIIVLFGKFGKNSSKTICH